MMKRGWLLKGLKEKRGLKDLLKGSGKVRRGLV